MKYTALLSLLLGMGSKLVYAEDQLSATLNESVIKIPTTVKTIFNQEVSKDMVVTQFKPNGDGPFPIVVLLHGRSYKDRSKPGRERFLKYQDILSTAALLCGCRLVSAMAILGSTLIRNIQALVLEKCMYPPMKLQRPQRSPSSRMQNSKAMSTQHASSYSGNLMVALQR